ncbi:MAG: hypothetical protein MI757_03645 [Pirellulales bacterium]|nr:hypothetical protein [Pirellulales bacterium]
MFYSLRQSRWYTFAMVGIAALLVTGALLRRPVTISTAIATIDETVVPVLGESLSPDAEIPEPPNAPIVSSTNIMTALADNALLRAACDAHGTHADTMVAEIAESLTVDVAPGPSENDRRITIRYRGGAPDGVSADEFSVAVVESLAQQYVDAHQSVGENGRVVALESARRQKRDARQKLDEAQLALRYARELAEKEAAEKEAANRTASTARRNPAWLDLHSQLLTLTKERDDLFQHAAPEHPDLKQYDAHIAELTRRIAATEQWIELESQVDQPPKKGATDQLSDALAKHHRTHGAVRDAEAKLQYARTELEAASSAESVAERSAREGAMLELTYYVDDATFRHVVKRSSRGSGGLACVLALAIGGLCAVCIGRPSKFFVSARQVKHTLSMPVLTTLPAEDGADSHAKVRHGFWFARASRLIAEIVVCAFFVSAILCATSDPAFAHELVQQPFTTLTGSVEQTLSTLSR